MTIIEIAIVALAGAVGYRRGGPLIAKLWQRRPRPIERRKRAASAAAFDRQREQANITAAMDAVLDLNALPQRVYSTLDTYRRDLSLLADNLRAATYTMEAQNQRVGAALALLADKLTVPTIEALRADLAASQAEVERLRRKVNALVSADDDWEDGD